VKLRNKIISKLDRIDRILDYKFRGISFPGFKSQSVYRVGKFFAKGIFMEELNLRASSLAFNFFIAIFPLIIFLFTLLPYVPIDNLGELITEIIARFLPSNASDFMTETINDIVNNQNAGLLSFGFIAAIYFASNGFASMISAFDSGLHASLQRNWFDVRLKSILLLLLTAALLVSTIVLSIWFSYSVDFFSAQFDLNKEFARFLLKLAEYLLTFFLVYLIFSSLYFFGSNKGAEWRFFSVGSTLGTILSIISTYGFRLYVENFNSYNKLYGSVGTLLVLLILIYVNCFVVLIGFELNRSVDRAGILE